MYTYKRTEANLWTVGHYEDGNWFPESDYDSRGEAAKRVIKLNGGSLNDDSTAVRLLTLLAYESEKMSANVMRSKIKEFLKTGEI